MELDGSGQEWMGRDWTGLDWTGRAQTLLNGLD